MSDATVQFMIAAAGLIIIPFFIWIVMSIQKLTLDMALVKQEQQFMKDMKSLLLDVRGFLSTSKL